MRPGRTNSQHPLAYPSSLLPCLPSYLERVECLRQDLGVLKHGPVLGQAEDGEEVGIHLSAGDRPRVQGSGLMAMKK